MTAPHAAPAARRTALALLATAVGVLPLKSLFTDWSWAVDVWLSMVIALGPAIWLRRRRPAGALDIWPGIVLLVPWLTVRFLRQHAIGGVIPGTGTGHDVSRLLTELHDTTANGVAPLHSTPAVRLVLCALLALLAALLDLLAVVGHRGALAGVPLLVVYTVSGAVPRRPVSWLWFLGAAVGFLLLLGLDARERQDSWGRRFRTADDGAARRWSVATPRIVVIALALAVIAPLAVPNQSRNLLADAFHGGHGNGSGFGFGNGSGGSISPFAQLRGQLNQPTPSPVATVHVTGSGSAQPFYLRVNVLDHYSNDVGFSVGNHGQEVPVDGAFDTAGGSADERSDEFTARITISGLRGNAPVFTVPTSVSGLTGATWSGKDQLLLGSSVSKGDSYDVTFRQPAPTTEQLDAAADAAGPELADDLALPANLPVYVDNLVKQLTANLGSPYQQARAVNDYFTGPDSAFVYDLKTQTGDSGSALVDFLQNKRGFCQQFAAAEAVMLRDAGIPSRVVLGYMHAPTDAKGNFTVTTDEAHAWVEAYFSGLGWVPFDPTPVAGLVGGRTTDLPWAPHPYASDAGNQNAPKGGTSGASATGSAAPSSATPSSTAPAVSATAPSHGGTSLTPVWWTLGLLALGVLALVPYAARRRSRRQRLARARRDGNADALWDELSATAVDLGYVWSPARSPRQVADWLGRSAADAAEPLRHLATAVEHDRYRPPGSPVTDVAVLEHDLRRVTSELRTGRGTRTRLRSLLWPASLGWGARLRRVFDRRGRS